jgi:ABC-type Fe3+-siderophore transport system permease subunit
VEDEPINFPGCDSVPWWSGAALLAAVAMFYVDSQSWLPWLAFLFSAVGAAVTALHVQHMNRRVAESFIDSISAAIVIKEGGDD